MNTPGAVRLRDLRRLAARPQRVGVLSDEIAHALDLVELSAGLRVPGQTRQHLARRLMAAAPVLDRMISRLGADFVVSGRLEADRTDHRTGADEISAGACSDPNAATHGGDGNSGECDHRAQTAAESREGGNTDDQSESSADAGNAAAGSDSGQSRGTPEPGEGAEPQGSGTQDGEGTTPSAAASAGDGKALAKPQEGEDGKPESGDSGLSDGDTQDAGEGQPAEMGAADAENPVSSHADMDCEPSIADGPDSAQGADNMSDEALDGEQEDVDHRQQDAEDGDIVRSLVHAARTNSPSRAQSPSQTAVVGTRKGGAAAVPYRDMPLKTKEAVRISAALRRLADVVGMASHAPTPKWDARALVRELVSERMALHRARQKDPQPRHILVMPDMSGSCSYVAKITSSIAASLAAADGRIIVTPTCTGVYSEGVITEKVYGKRADVVKKVMQRLRKDHLSTKKDWQALKSAGVTHILVMGDVHGHTSYEAARDAGVKVIWCDPNAKEMPVKDTHNMIYEAVERPTAQSIAKTIEKAISRTPK